MPIYEYYCPDNNTIYQFYAKTLAQGQTVPKCPHNPAYRMSKLVSAFAVTGRAKEEPAGAAPAGSEGADDPRMDAAMAAMEREFSNVDENDPRAMARMMRRMSELTGEKIDPQMEEVVRKLEEGADPDSLEDQLGEEAGGGDGAEAQGEGAGPGGEKSPDEAKEARRRFRARRQAPRRDPTLYDFE